MHDAAREVIAELRRERIVEVQNHSDTDEFFPRLRVAVDDVVTLVPRDADHAPITFAFTTFPGVVVRAGMWHTAAYPQCGCDACDERPEDVVDLMRRDVASIVDGRFVEEWDGERLHHALTYEDGRIASGWQLIDRDRARFGAPRRIEWRTWVPRPAGGES